MTESLPIDGRSLTFEQFLAVVEEGCRVALAPDARAAVSQSRRAVERAVEKGHAVYGVTTGFGGSSHHRVPSDQARAHQIGLLRSHASGAGPLLDPEVVRGMLVLRANSLAAGHSGVRPELIERLLDLLNLGLVPAVPRQGSVGASGDLAPLAHAGLAAIGEGEFVEPNGRRTNASEVLATHGLGTIELVEKEGVALVNGTSLMTSYLALSVRDADRLLEAGRIAAAMAFDALRGDTGALDDRLGTLRRLPEQRAEAEGLRTLLAGSGLSGRSPEYEGQDPYTLRCLPQVLASTRLAIGFARRILDGELNAVTDNPVIFEGDEFLSGGNFHGEPLALALDLLAIGAQQLAGFSERRTARLVDPARNRGLPAFLTAGPSGSSGLMLPQYLAAALVNENQSLAHPASTASWPTSADQEDYVSMGAWSGAKLRMLLDNCRTVVAIEWIVAGQALELRRPAIGGVGSEAALRALRALVAPWSTDRQPAPAIEAVRSALARGSLTAAVRASLKAGA